VGQRKFYMAKMILKIFMAKIEAAVRYRKSSHIKVVFLDKKRYRSDA
jgi:hypothetical protein